MQATARDLLAAALIRLEAAGFPIAAHVHDEVIAEIPAGADRTAEFLAVMTTAPSWADGLPIAGKPWQRPRFLKTNKRQIAGSPNQPEIKPMRDDDPPWSGSNYDRSKASGAGTIEREHIYLDEHGKPYLKVVVRRDRNGKKQCPQYHWTGNQWLKGAPHPKIPYRLPELLAAAVDVPVHIAEGEKDCDRLAALGFAATTNPEGARKGSWPADFGKYFAGRKRVFIPEDNDDPGHAFAGEKAKALEGIVPDIRIVSFPDVPAGEDVTYWTKTLGHTEAEYLARCEATPKWEPARLESICAADVKMKAVAWLWPNRFALRKLGIIAGLPDEGKRLLINYVAATITTGRAWPVNEDIAPLGNVIYLQAEDGPEDTVVPRLKAAGADLAKIHFINMVKDEGRKRMFSLQADLGHLRKKIDSVGNVKLVLIDPVSAYMGVGKMDSYRTTDVRAVLGPVKQLGEELGIAIIGVMHFNKKVDITNALLRISDSFAYGAAARHVYAAIDDRENERKLLVRAKNNLVRGDRGGMLAYRFQEKNVGTDHETGEPIYAPYIKFDPAYIDITATEAMSAAAENKSPGAREEAMEFLEAQFADGKPVDAREIEAMAKAEGIAIRTLRRAKKALKIISKQSDGKWMWFPAQTSDGQWQTAREGKVAIWPSEESDYPLCQGF